MTLLHALLVFAWADVTVSQDAELSVGKVRSSADVAFSNGEIDQALKLWGKVTMTAFIIMDTYGKIVFQLTSMISNRLLNWSLSMKLTFTSDFEFIYVSSNSKRPWLI